MTVQIQICQLLQYLIVTLHTLQLSVTAVILLVHKLLLPTSQFSFVISENSLSHHLIEIISCQLATILFLEKNPPPVRAVSHQASQPHHDVLNTTSGSDGEEYGKISGNRTRKKGSSNLSLSLISKNKIH
jgi:uncharacterized membrane protein